MSSSLRELIEELDRQKRKYHEKLLTADGELSLVFREMQIYDMFVDIAYLLIPEFFFSNIMGSLLFGFDLIDLEPLNIEFTWRFPDLDEWLRGVSIVFERITPDYAVSAEEFVRTNVKEEHREGLLATAAEKGVYGRSRYGYSYYDPPAVREFLASTVYSVFRRYAPHPSRRAAIDSMVKALDINPDVARMVHDRISMIISAHTECFILNYGILNVTKLCEEAHHSPALGVVPFVDYDGNVREAEILTMADMQAGCILDVSVLDYCFLMPDEDIYLHDAETIIGALDDRLRRFAGRAALTAQGISNYVRGDEAADYHRAERTNVWGELMALRYALESVVDSFISRVAPGLNPFDRRKYISAALQLVGHVGKRHSWGYRAYRAMEEDELRRWWVEHWSRQGLDRELLEKLFDSLKDVLRSVVKRKLELGKKMRLERLGIPLD